MASILNIPEQFESVADQIIPILKEYLSYNDRNLKARHSSFQAMKSLIEPMLVKVGPKARANAKKIYMGLSSKWGCDIKIWGKDIINEYGWPEHVLFENCSYLYSEEGLTDRVMWTWFHGTSEHYKFSNGRFCHSGYTAYEMPEFLYEVFKKCTGYYDKIR